MEYEDLVLELGTDAAEPTVRVARSPAGESEPERLKLDLSARDLAALGSAYGRAIDTSRGAAEPVPVEVAETSLLELGGRLFQALFPSKARDRYQQSLGRCAISGRGLRLRIEMGLGNPRLVRLHTIPWEFVASESHFLALSRDVSVVRHLALGYPTDRPPLPGPVTILVLAGEKEGGELDLEQERLQLEMAWSEKGAVRVRLLRECTLDAMREELIAHDCHVVHFMGHGAFLEESGEGLLAFRDAAGRRSWVSGSELADQIRDRGSLRFVFLNACSTAQISVVSPYAGVATALLGAGVPAVLAMQFLISDDAALAFSRTFYRRIARGDSIDTAVAEGRLALRRLSWDCIEWATPVLFQRQSSGRIVTAGKAAAPSASGKKLGLGLAVGLALLGLIVAILLGLWLSFRPVARQEARGLADSAKGTLFRDDFDDNRNHWLVSTEYGTSSAEISAGHYFISPEPSSGYLTTLPLALNYGERFKIECRLKKLSADDGNFFGLVWGYQDDNNFFNFSLMGNGRVAITRRKEGQFYDYIDTSVVNPFVNLGDAYNVLTLEREGAVFRFYINGHLTHTMPFEPFLGLDEGFLTYNGVQIAIDYLVVTAG